MKMTVLCLLIIFSLSFSAYPYSAEGVRVVFLSDGYSTETEKIADVYENEIKTISKGSYNITFAREHGEWNSGKIKALFKKLQNDKNIDIIIAMGLITGRTSFYSEKLNKPVFIPYMLKTDIPNYPKKQNLNYISVETDIEEILADFSKAVKYSSPLIIADETFRTVGLDIIMAFAQKLCSQECAPQVIYSSSRNEDISGKIPKGTDAAIVMPIPRMDDSSIKKLTDKLAELKIPSVYTFDTAHESSGFMMSARTLTYENRARLTALNILDVLKGEKPETQAIFVDEKYELAVDLSVMRKIGIPLPFVLAEKAVLINEEDDCCEKLTLRDAVREAVKANLRLIAGELDIKADNETVKEIRSELFPNITAQIEYLQMNEDNDYVETGSYAQRSTEGGLTLRQLIFSEKTLARLEIQKLAHVSLKEQQKALELDISKLAAETFLNALMAKTSKNIQQSHLRLSSNNLELAGGRVEAGISDMSDVYYWESEIAAAKQRLLNAVSEEEKAFNTLNMVLDRPFHSEYTLVPASLEQLSLKGNVQRLAEIITDSRKYGIMAEYFIKESEKNSPELANLDAQIKAVSRQLLSEKRADYTPEVYLSGRLTSVLDEQRNGDSEIDLEGETNWQVGVTASLPLFEGNAGKSRKARSGYRIAMLRAEKRNADNALRQDVLNSLSSLKASYSSIELSKQSAEAARKSFLIIRDNYAEGTKPMTDLLIAQTTSTESELASANAVYRCMSDLISLQRSLGSGSLFLEPARHKGFTDGLIDYINRKE
jgi:outer membrane protein TolC/ABC-type uncharacterized transport system substrate-binding protein